MLPVAKGVEVTCYYFYFYRTFREKAKTFLKKRSMHPQVTSQNNTFFLHFDDLTVDIYQYLCARVYTSSNMHTHVCAWCNGKNVASWMGHVLRGPSPCSLSERSTCSNPPPTYNGRSSMSCRAQGIINIIAPTWQSQKNNGHFRRGAFTGPFRRCPKAPAGCHRVLPVGESGASVSPRPLAQQTKGRGSDSGAQSTGPWEEPSGDTWPATCLQTVLCH